MVTISILNTRYGREVRSPSTQLLEDALGELYVENQPSLTEADYEEHGASWQRAGQQEGPMYVIYVTRHHRMTLETWADWDYEQEVRPPITIEQVEQSEALTIWCQLKAGEYKAVESHFLSAGSAERDA